MEQKKPQRKELLSYFITTSKVDVKRINWGFQMKLLNSLLVRFSEEEIRYAINYYVQQGVEMYSLGYLLHANHMEKPVSLYHAEQNTTSEGSGERNRKRMELNHKAQRRTDAPEYLFTGTE